MARFYPLARGFEVYSGWGPRWGAFHAGLDFGKPGGSGGLPVFAAQGGTVQSSGPASGFGQWVVIDHPHDDGSGTTVYGHVIPEVPVGRRVEAGQRIARVNPTKGAGNGNVDPHCHFEVHNSVWTPSTSGRQDPAPWLNGAAYPGEQVAAPSAPAPVAKPAPAPELFGIDVSNHQADRVDMARVRAEGFVAVIAKASEGSTYVDPWFGRNRDQARANGLTFVGYHYVRAGDPRGNAACWDRAVGGDRSIRCMLDVEHGSGNGADYWATRRAIEALGYRVVLTYLPDWYWAGAMGRPSLADVGPIMSSEYGADQPASAWSLYHEHGGRDRWADYGGGRTQILQFTQRAQVAGQQIDAWAYRGTRAQLDALLTGSTLTAQSEEDDMPSDDRIRDLVAEGVERVLWRHDQPSRVPGSPINTEAAKAGNGLSLADGILNADAYAWRLVEQITPAIVAAVSALAGAGGSSLTPEQITEAVKAGVKSVVQVRVSVDKADQ